MKKYLLWLPALLLAGSLALYNIKLNTTQQTGKKAISFAVYKSISYTSGAYSNTSAQLQITIDKVSGTRHDTVWNTIFDAKLLRDYPAPAGAFIKTVTVPNINDYKDHLEVTYTCVYNSNGYTLQVKNTAVIDRNSGDRLDIRV